MNLTAKQLYQNFVHRKDTWAEMQTSGRYFPTNKPITIKDIEEHLEGKKTIALYCLNTDNTVKWGCVDLDLDIKCSCGSSRCY